MTESPAAEADLPHDEPVSQSLSDCFERSYKASVSSGSQLEDVGWSVLKDTLPLLNSQ